MGFIKPTFKDWILDFQFKSIFFYKWHICILLGMYIVGFFIGFLFWKSCKFWRRLRALDYIWKSGVGFTLFYFTNLFVDILGRKGSGTMIFIVSWCYGGLAMVIFILFWQGSYPPWWHHTGIIVLWYFSNKPKTWVDLKWVEFGWYQLIQHECAGNRKLYLQKYSWRSYHLR